MATVPYRHPGYDPPGFTEHIAMHQEYREIIDITWGHDRIESCSVCDPRIAATRYAHNEALKRDEIEAPLLARINAVLTICTEAEEDISRRRYPDVKRLTAVVRAAAEGIL